MDPVSARSSLKRLVPPALVRLRMLSRYGLTAYRSDPSSARHYVLCGKEVDNFTYEIENRDELSTMISSMLGSDRDHVGRLIAEIDADEEFTRSLKFLLEDRIDRPSEMPLGRRVGWYAVTRLLRPQIVVETGVHDGLGSAVLLRALERNRSEGAPGTLVSFDVRSDVGWLVPERLRTNWELVIGDSVAVMRDSFDPGSVGLFIHDSLHTYEHEQAELSAVIDAMQHPGALISDNAHATTALKDFCASRDIPFARFLERPVGTWYPGSGLGLGVLGPIHPPPSCG